MALAYDTSSNLASSTTTANWSHGGSASAKGAIVVITGGATEGTSGVTYGGVAMLRKATGANLSGETGTTSVWFLGDGSLPTGTQTVEVTRTVADAYIATCWTVTATNDVEYITGYASQSTNTSDLATSLTIPSGRVVFIAGGAYSGENALSSITDKTGQTRDHQQDFGNFTSVISRRSTLYTGTGAALTTFGWTQSSDDGAWAVIAIAEQAVQNYNRTTTRSGTGSITTSGYVARSTTASLAGAGTITAAGVVARAASASLSGSGALTGTGAVTAVRSSSLDATGTITASGEVAALATSTLTGTGSITTDELMAAARTSTLSGTGAITAAGARGYHGTAALDAAGTITLTELMEAAGSATLTGTGLITSTGIVSGNTGVHVDVANGWLDTMDDPWVQLHTGDPGATGSLLVSAGTSARVQAITGAAASANKALSANTDVWVNTGATESITHITLWSASSGGTCYMSIQLDSPISWDDTNTILLDAMSVGLSAVGA